ncbi:MAG: type II toxin-antitoxin system PemK/MazF family toxin [Rhodospirillales bacterium]|nr:type II toxin-antitoxin system PemK/MazF family toxin [Rhodospirillales bacterium]
MSKEREDGSHKVIVCPITHTPPEKGQSAVEIPYKVAQSLKLDHDQMWIKTHQVNTLEWEKDRLPYGISLTPRGEWEYGMLPYGLREKMYEQVEHNRAENQLGVVKRDENPESVKKK